MDGEYAPAHLEMGLIQVKREVLSEGLQELERYIEIVGPTRAGPNLERTKELIEQLKFAANAGG